jgi:hypothetical protein
MRGANMRHYGSISPKLSAWCVLFFTVNLANRRSRILTEYIDSLRRAFRETRQIRPFTIEPGRMYGSGMTDSA